VLEVWKPANVMWNSGEREMKCLCRGLCQWKLNGLYQLNDF
jgi:hypothetical protein